MHTCLCLCVIVCVCKCVCVYIYMCVCVCVCVCVCAVVERPLMVRRVVGSFPRGGPIELFLIAGSAASLLFDG